jgi:Lon protease-like protein
MNKSMNDHLLPKEVIIVPVFGSVLMPRALLPIPFTKEEFEVLDHSLQGPDHFVGIVQPINPENNKNKTLSLFKSGCLGAVVDAQEEDDQVVVTINGVCRFDIVKEKKSPNLLFRLADVNYESYSQDLVDEADFNLDRPRLFKALKRYFNHYGFQPDWEEIDLASNDRLVTTLTMFCPFSPNEKQALLEAKSLNQQSEMLTALIEFDIAEHELNPSPSCH